MDELQNCEIWGSQGGSSDEHRGLPGRRRRVIDRRSGANQSYSPNTEAEGSPETSINLYHTISSQIAEDIRK